MPTISSWTPKGLKSLSSWDSFAIRDANSVPSCRPTDESLRSSRRVNQVAMSVQRVLLWMINNLFIVSKWHKWTMEALTRPLAASGNFVRRLTGHNSSVPPHSLCAWRTCLTYSYSSSDSLSLSVSFIWHRLYAIWNPHTKLRKRIPKMLFLMIVEKSRIVHHVTRHATKWHFGSQL